ncbi:protein rep [Dietzia sp. SLG510A3-3B2-2]|nr:protein rep [Dietzia sp. SLG510A3-40A3]MBB1008756.1 protein rep [Dietzia sp. SLG510A3-3B2-2]
MSQPANQRVSGFRGLYSCGSVWSCPRCASVIARKRTDELETVLAKHRRDGGHGVLLTLTLAHGPDHRLSDVWDACNDAWKKLTNNRTWKDLRHYGGLDDFVRITEAVHRYESGWHVHFHVLLLFESVDHAFFGLVMSRHVFRAWRSAVHNLKRGFYASDFGQDVRPATVEEHDEIRSYLFKGLRTWSIADEMARLSSKRGKGSSRTPFQILASIAYSMNTFRDLNLDSLDPSEEGALVRDFEQDLNLWQEWEQASQCRRQITWSKGLKADAGLTPSTDKDLVTDSDHGSEAEQNKEAVDALDQDTSEIAGIPADSWRLGPFVNNPGLQEAIKRIAESAESELDLYVTLKSLAEEHSVEILVGAEWHSYLYRYSRPSFLPRPRRNRPSARTKRWSRMTPEYHSKIISDMKKWRLKRVHFESNCR